MRTEQTEREGKGMADGGKVGYGWFMHVLLKDLCFYINDLCFIKASNCPPGGWPIGKKRAKTETDQGTMAILQETNDGILDLGTNIVVEDCKLILTLEQTALGDRLSIKGEGKEDSKDAHFGIALYW